MGVGAEMSIIYPDSMLPCPICGRKAYVMHDIVDGFEFGWSAGCPVFKLNDGIHGITEENIWSSKIPNVHYMVSRQEAIETWNEKVMNWKN